MADEIKFIQDGNTFSVVKLNEETTKNILKPAVYSVQFANMRGYFLMKVSDHFEVPEKIYGKVDSRVKKVEKTYLDRDTSTGVLLSGDKGSGKSLTMAMIANHMIEEHGMPVIMIREPFTGEDFTEFLNLIGECVIMIDEFGKLYKNADNGGQAALLSIFDGVSKSNRLFLLSENNTFEINEFMLNRPGRIYYHFQHKKLDEDSIAGYCTDNNISEREISDIIELSRKSRTFSFDMLQTIVEEHKRFNESIFDCIADLNIEIEDEAETNIQITKIEHKASGHEYAFPKDEIYGKYNFEISIYTDESKVPVSIHSNRTEAQPVSDSDNNDDGFVDMLWVNSNHLKYESKDMLVYDNGEYIIYAKPKIVFNRYAF